MRIDRNTPANQTPISAPLKHGSDSTKATSLKAFEKSVAPNLQAKPRPHDWDIADEGDQKSKNMRKSVLGG